MAEPAGRVAEPALVYPGSWRITADLPRAQGSTSFFELSESGAASGWTIGNGGRHPAAKSAVPDVQYHGQWAYHKASRTLTFDFSASMSAIAGSRSAIWQIELLGCQTGAVYGRDHRMVSYVLEYAGVE